MYIDKGILDIVPVNEKVEIRDMQRKYPGITERYWSDPLYLRAELTDIGSHERERSEALIKINSGFTTKASPFVFYNCILDDNYLAIIRQDDMYELLEGNDVQLFFQRIINNKNPEENNEPDYKEFWATAKALGKRDELES